MNETEMMLALRSWQTINKALPGMDEDDCKSAINQEIKGKCRRDIVLRLHQRYSALRVTRERLELESVMDAPSFLTTAFEGTT